MGKDLKLRFVLLVALLPALASMPGLLAQDTSALQDEESTDYYESWLKKDVVYIITGEERSVFEKLTSPEEKESFIEQFWRRRDLNLRTAENEFKEEHYRRIAYANEHFTSGFQGWRTDRGRTYIIHGPPVSVERYPTGGVYERPYHEGGGTTTVYPFEVWWYRYIEGVGMDVELEFVDPSSTGEYRLALRPEEKDALLHIDGIGLTLAEQMGLASKADRPFFSPGNRERYPMMIQREQDSLFARWERHALVQRPPQIKFEDLKEVVEIRIDYNTIPLEVRSDYIRLNDRQFIVPITVEIADESLTFKPENDSDVARLAIYGIVTSLTNKVIVEFEDEIMKTRQTGQAPSDDGVRMRSLYQKIIFVEAGTRYKLDLVVKDRNSNTMGVKHAAIVPPAVSESQLAVSSLILSDRILKLDEVPEDPERFVLGDIWIRPRPSGTFGAGSALGVYFQVYNCELDQSSLAPSVELSFSLVKDGQLIYEASERNGASIQFASNRRVVVVKALPGEQLEPGNYQIRIAVRDEIAERSVSASQNFTITAETLASASR